MTSAGAPGHPKLVLTVVWKVPSLGATTNCASCLVSNGRWTIKEGMNDLADPNDTFRPASRPRDAARDRRRTAAETKLAGGYEIAVASCATHRGDREPSDERRRQRREPRHHDGLPACLHVDRRAAKAGPRIRDDDHRGDGNPRGRAQQCCIADLGTNCDDQATSMPTFSRTLVTLIFHVADAGPAEGLRDHVGLAQRIPVTAATCATDR